MVGGQPNTLNKAHNWSKLSLTSNRPKFLWRFIVSVFDVPHKGNQGGQPKLVKKFFHFLFLIFTIVNITIAHADTITMTWLNEDSTTYNTTTCAAGDDVILPTAPTKRGYTFVGWRTYTPIEYLKSTGTQYIDTGIKVNSDYSVEIKGIFNCAQVACGEEGATFNSHGKFVLAIACSSEGSAWGGNAINSTASQLDINTNNFYTLKIDKYGIYKDNIKKLSFNPPPYKVDSTNNFLLFATKASYYGWSSDAIQYVKIYNKDTLVRYFISALDDDNTPCMFDKVEGKFYYNTGTGNFIAGSVINEQ